MSHTYTWDKLVKSCIRINPRSRGANYPYVPKFELLGIIPFIGTKSCLVKLQAWGVTQNSLHQVTMLFSDCDIKEGEHQTLSLWEYFKIEYQGKTYFVKKFDKVRNPLTSRCTCKDFFFTFAFYNYRNGNCLYGPMPKPYQRKTLHYPPRNPMGIPGICKHLYHAWEYLKNQGLTSN